MISSQWRSGLVIPCEQAQPAPVLFAAQTGYSKLLTQERPRWWCARWVLGLGEMVTQRDPSDSVGEKHTDRQREREKKGETNRICKKPNSYREWDWDRREKEWQTETDTLTEGDLCLFQAPGACLELCCPLWQPLCGCWVLDMKPVSTGMHHVCETHWIWKTEYDKRNVSYLIDHFLILKS